MSLYMLDTDTMTLAQFGHAAVVAQLGKQADADVALPVISLQEQMREWLGRLARLNASPPLADWYDRLVNRMFPLWRRYQLISFSEPAILRFDQLRALRLNVGSMDLRIAAIALGNSLTVVTRNQRDFSRVPGLNSVDWSV